MVGTKLKKITQEIDNYLDLPYMTNIIRDGKVVKERVLGGKGYWKDIKKETQKIAASQKINLKKLTSKQLYQFQKKHKIGIDCSGLATQLLIFYGRILGKKVNLNPRKTSADMLTSTPLATKITDDSLIQTGDLKTINYVDSSFWGRGVKYGQFDITDPTFDNQGIYRLLFFN